MYGWCIRLVLEEGVCRESGTDVHDEIVHRTMSRMHDVCLVLEQVVDVPPAVHNLVLQKHDLFFHAYSQIRVRNADVCKRSSDA